MHPDLKTVIELQQLDMRVAEFTAQIDALPSEIQALEAQLHEFTHTHEDRQQRLAVNQKERRDLEGEIQIIQARITKHKDQLYQVKTNEQYRAMLKEIEGEEANIRQVEDQVLEKMLEAEQLENQIREAASRLEGEKARVAGDIKRLRDLRQADVEERNRLLAHRQELVAAVSPSVADLYERVRKVRHGVAAVEARDGCCTACNVRLRPQVYNDVRTNASLQTCETCDRILYYVEPHPSQEATAGEASGKTDRAAAAH